MQASPASEPGEMVCVDLIEPFPKSAHRNTKLLAVVNYFTKWIYLHYSTPKIGVTLIKEVFTRWRMLKKPSQTMIANSSNLRVSVRPRE